MYETLLELDSQLLLLINGYHTPFLDSFMMLVTGRFIWIPMYAIVLLILFKKFKPMTAVLLTLGLIAAITLADQGCATFIRPYVQRLRPSNLENPLSALIQVVDGYRGGAYGFPSCHAANSFALAAFLCLVIRRRGFMAFIIFWASLNSYSRMYLGVHYPSDIIVGAVIGACCGALCYFSAIYIAKNFFNFHVGAEHDNIQLPTVVINANGMSIASSQYLAGNIMITVGLLIALIIVGISVLY